MSKQLKIILLLLGLALGIYFAFIRKPWKSFSGDGTDFSIMDTGAVTKLFLADARGNKVLLAKQPNLKWLVDNQVEADERKVNLLLQTLFEMKMRNPISKNEYNTVIKEFASDGIKVECYQGDELIKTIIVGQATNDQLGTYMMIQGSETPYVVHIPGFIGYLTPRFPTTPIKWKNKLVFDVEASQIKSVQVAYPGSPNESFFIEQASAITVKNHHGQLVPCDNKFVSYYLASFTKLYAESYDDTYTTVQHDSISKTPIFCTVKITDTNGKVHELKLHKKSIDARTKMRYTEAGEELSEDTEKYFGFMDGSTSMMHIQYYSFGRILRKLSEFPR